MSSQSYLNLAATLASNIDPHVVAPNPRVGCVIVQDGKVVAEGVHERFGGPHAEVVAMRALGLHSSQNPPRSPLEKGGRLDVYITLEPCTGYPGKKTPSCTSALLDLKPAKVVVGALDPKWNGENLEQLRAAGITVEYVDHAPSRALNPFFETYTKTKRPYVTVKLAMSLDGRIVRPAHLRRPLPQSLPQGEREAQYISNEASRRKVHEMRAQYSAILTTTETVLRDDPRLDCRLGRDDERTRGRDDEGVGRAFSNPHVVVVGKRKNEIPGSARIFSDSKSPQPPLTRGRKIHWFETHDLVSVIEQCGEMGIDSIMTECGATVCTELLHLDLVDEVQLFVAPEIFGKGKLAFCDDLSSNFEKFELAGLQNLDGDVWVRHVKV